MTTIQNANSEYENSMHKKSNSRKRTIILIIIAIIAGLGLIAAVLLISIEFNQIYRLTQDTSVLAFRTSSSTTTTTIKRTVSTTSIDFSNSTIQSTTSPLTTTTANIITTTIPIILMNKTTTSTAIEDISVPMNSSLLQ